MGLPFPNGPTKSFSPYTTHPPSKKASESTLAFFFASGETVCSCKTTIAGWMASKREEGALIQSMTLPSVNWRALAPALKGGMLASALVLFILVAGARPQELPASANDLVRQVVANELKPDPTHFMYRATRERADGGTETKQMVETRDGIFARVIAINGKPLTPAQ